MTVNFQNHFGDMKAFDASYYNFFIALQLGLYSRSCLIFKFSCCIKCNNTMKYIIIKFFLDEFANSTGTSLNAF